MRYIALLALVALALVGTPGAVAANVFCNTNSDGVSTCIFADIDDVFYGEVGVDVNLDEYEVEEVDWRKGFLGEETIIPKFDVFEGTVLPGFPDGYTVCAEGDGCQVFPELDDAERWKELNSNAQRAVMAQVDDLPEGNWGLTLLPTTFSCDTATGFVDQDWAQEDLSVTIATFPNFGDEIHLFGAGLDSEMHRIGFGTWVFSIPLLGRGIGHDHVYLAMDSPDQMSGYREGEVVSTLGSYCFWQQSVQAKRLK